MKNTFIVFETRDLNDAYDVDAIQKKYNVIFPPLFRVFIETFKFQKMIRRPQHYVVYFDIQIGFEDFDQPLEKTLDVYLNEESYIKRKMLPLVASGIHSGGICLGLEGPDEDRIFVHDELFEGKFRKIANNIFEFIRGLKEIHFDDI